MNTAWEYGLLSDMTQEEAILAAELACLHDVGKILLPHELRYRPGSLTLEEYRIVKRHPIWGEALIAHYMGELRDTSAFTYTAEICLHHHERWDGSGYPDGLKGNEIAKYVQVAGLADAYDALVAPRTYKPAMNHRPAANLILSGGCGVFAPWLTAILAEQSDYIETVVYAPPDEQQHGGSAQNNSAGAGKPAPALL